MKTIILAAGQGTRLRPYTADKPKCMVELGGKPLLHWQLEALSACGITEGICVVGGYRADRLDAPGTRMLLNPRYHQTNMVSTLFCARESMQPGEDLLISYGDIVYQPDVLQTLLSGQGEICLAADRQWRRLWQLRMDNPLSDAETFVMDANQRVRELGKKPDTYDQVQAQYMGLIKVRGDRVADFTEHFDRMDTAAHYDGKDFANMYMTSFIQNLIDNGWEVDACLVDNGWLEIDTAEELECYQEMLDSGQLNSYCTLPGKTHG